MLTLLWPCFLVEPTWECGGSPTCVWWWRLESSPWPFDQRPSADKLLLFTVQNECIVDPKVQSIWIGSKLGIGDYLKEDTPPLPSLFYGPHGWIIRWALLDFWACGVWRRVADLYIFQSLPVFYLMKKIRIKTCWIEMWIDVWKQPKLGEQYWELLIWWLFLDLVLFLSDIF